MICRAAQLLTRVSRASKTNASAALTAGMMHRVTSNTAPVTAPISCQMRPFSDSVEEAVNNILYDTPVRKASQRRVVLTALVNNEPGVLSRISGVLAARAVNISSLVVGETEMKQLSRTTLVLSAGEDVEQVKKQLEDIVQVWAVVEYGQDVAIIERELILIKIDCMQATSVHPFMGNEDAGNTASSMQTRASIIELTKIFGGKVVDVAAQHVTVELTAKASRIDAFIALVRPFGIQECARSGCLAMLRGSMSGFEEEPEELEEEDEGPDATMLPPG